MSANSSIFGSFVRTRPINLKLYQNIEDVIFIKNHEEKFAIFMAIKPKITISAEDFFEILLKLFYNQIIWDRTRPFEIFDLGWPWTTSKSKFLKVLDQKLKYQL